MKILLFKRKCFLSWLSIGQNKKRGFVWKDNWLNPRFCYIYKWTPSCHQEKWIIFDSCICHNTRCAAWHVLETEIQYKQQGFLSSGICLYTQCAHSQHIYSEINSDFKLLSDKDIQYTSHIQGYVYIHVYREHKDISFPHLKIRATSSSLGTDHFGSNFYNCSHFKRREPGVLTNTFPTYRIGVARVEKLAAVDKWKLTQMKVDTKLSPYEIQFIYGIMLYPKYFFGHRTEVVWGYHKGE